MIALRKALLCGVLAAAAACNSNSTPPPTPKVDLFGSA